MRDYWRNFSLKMSTQDISFNFPSVVIKVKVTQKNKWFIDNIVCRKDIYLIATHFTISIFFINSDQEKKQRDMYNKLSIDNWY